MKTNFQSGITLVLLIGALSLFANGCSTVRSTVKPTGVDRAEKTTDSMHAVDADMRQASIQIDTVKASLDDLVKRGQAPGAQADDVKATYATFSKNVDEMDKVGKKLSKDIDKMSSSGNAYFEQWAKEGGTYTDPDIQRLSEERRTKLSAAFRDMQSSTGSVRANLNAYMSDLHQIQKYLSNDLTPQGIAAISSTAKAVEQDGSKLKQSFNPVENSILQARDLLTPGGAATGGAAKPKEADTPRK